jgi:lysophospholipase L1-like esterase
VAKWDAQLKARAVVARLKALNLSSPKFDSFLSEKGKAAEPAEAQFAVANILPGTEPNPNSKLDLQPFEYHGNIPGNDPQWDSPTTPKTGKVVLALAGDSTVTYTQGYAAGFKSHLDKQLQVIDFSRGGRTTVSFRSDGRWDQIIALKPDYVMIQFGHNDGTRDLPRYSSDLARFVDEARAAGIKPILVTPISRRYFQDDGKIHSDLLQNVEAMKKVAAEKNVPLMDLHQAAINFYEKVGKPVTDTWGLKKDNPDLRTAPNPDAIAQKLLDKTHFNPAGSMAIGKVVSDELKRTVPELAPYIE